MLFVREKEKRLSDDFHILFLSLRLSLLLSLCFYLSVCVSLSPSVPWGSYYDQHLWAWFMAQPSSLSRAHYYCITVCPAAPGGGLTSLTVCLFSHFFSLGEAWLLMASALVHSNSRTAETLAVIAWPFKTISVF